MKRMFSVAVIAVAVIVGALIIPGGRISAANPDPVQVTNVPLPVTVGNFPETVRVGGTVSAAQSGPWAVQQSGPWTVEVASPKRFHQRKFLNILTLEDGAQADVLMPDGAVIETISVNLHMPPGQRPKFGMALWDQNGIANGVANGAIHVPVQFQTSSNGVDFYCGTLTNLGVTTFQKVTVGVTRDIDLGAAFGDVTVAGYIQP
jgi:hypothetical protein